MTSGFLFRLLLILPAALLCGLQNNNLFVPLCSLLLLIPFLLTQKRLSATVLHCALLTLPAASLAFLPLFLSGAASGGIFSDLRFFLPMCCYCAALFLYLDNAMPACITGLIVFLLLVRPGVPVNTLIPKGSGLMDLLFPVAVFFSASAAILLFSEKTAGGRNAMRLCVLLLLLPLPFFMVLLNKGYQTNYKTLRSWNLRGLYFSLLQRDTGYGNRNESDISQPVQRDPEFENRILFYVESEEMPAYLKSHTFVNYKRSTWYNPYAVSEELTFETKDYTSVYSLTEKPEGAASGSLTVYPADEELFDNVPVPENAHTLELVAEKTLRSPWGDLMPIQWDRNAAYTVHFFRDGKNITSMPPEGKECLSIPPYLYRPLFRLLSDANGIFATMGTPRNDRETAMTIAAWLQQNYIYSLEPPDETRNRYRDPIFRFLFSTKKGHCELFASACTMLLRSAGLPAKYVTGFVCRRKLDDGLWYSTGFDSHAWTEVYLPDEQRWITLDATPGSGDMEIVITPASFRDRFFLLKSKIAAYFRNGRFLNWWDGITQHPWQYLLFLPLPVLIVLAVIYRKRRHRKTLTLKLEKHKRLAAKSFLKLAKKTMRKSGIKRKKNETFREWINRLEETDRTQLLPALREYEKKRFSD